MDAVLNEFVTILQEFGSGATFPLTAAPLERTAGVVEKYEARNVEYAVHGFFHVDHSRLERAEQLRQLERARRVFASRGLAGQGFRSPY
ncbi:polysaccharide deacetylase family protein, partial [Escherichia coli]|uniref:polysaccharide deacetylase family protein n=1 Tax=Escherichia coli TaxID=562 RepID=UPI0021F2DFDA